MRYLRKKLSISILTLAILLGFPFMHGETVHAASSLPAFTYTSDGVFSWEFVKDADAYRITFSELGFSINMKTSEKYSFNGCATWKANGVSFDLRKYFDQNNTSITEKTYTVTVTAMHSVNSLNYANTVKYSYKSAIPKLETPKNLKWNKRILSWDEVPGADDYFVAVYDAKTGNYVWRARIYDPTVTTIDTGKTSPHFQDVPLVYDENSNYYFKVFAYGKSGVSRNSDDATSYTINGSEVDCESGTTGSCRCVYNAEKSTLTISGNGAMGTYYNYNKVPWYTMRSEIKTIIIGNGVTNISNHAFYGTKISSITIPDSVSKIGEGAFSYCSELSEVKLGTGLKEIGTRCFESAHGAGMYKLTSMTIPANVTTFGKHSIGYISYASGGTMVYEVITGFKITGACSSKAFDYAEENKITWVSNEHTVSKAEVTKESTCTQKGKETVTCRCGYTYTRDIPLKHHTLTRVPANPATETADGNIEYYICSECHDWFEDDAGEKLITDHSSVIIAKGTVPVKPDPEKPDPEKPDPVKPDPEKPKPKPEIKPTEEDETPGKEEKTPVPSSGEDEAKKSTTDATKVENATPDPKPEGTALTDESQEAEFVVTSAAKENPTVDYKRTTNKKVKKITIPQTITMDGVTYNVTGIASKAFNGCSKLTTITFGNNIEFIRANAFKGAKNLKTINAKSSKLTNSSVAKKAFKGVGSRVTVKVPKKLKKTYSKLFVKKGLAKSIKIK
ncbi:leucine-rich repeat domain-containing protein [Butyrivibrio sp. WCD2001]|uniref:leucine-rich repeat domain-containing protein n=1 Tax=Butyrivibrio sp. WCD2001 TaxID=1280681 RepID=UPI000479942A|nr:leucine-rich repeat domain-containing protein [Butyrivibrio sp. WCD2001]